mmetsp:Transcript_8295/g.23677  ORF Transcript_8295/g.23677 Transcript_8295/m.23677 type:complete len:279 (+) Transcript_8295:2326-3162(+)
MPVRRLLPEHAATHAGAAAAALVLAHLGLLPVGAQVLEAVAAPPQRLGFLGPHEPHDLARLRRRVIRAQADPARAVGEPKPGHAALRRVVREALLGDADDAVVRQHAHLARDELDVGAHDGAGGEDDAVDERADHGERAADGAALAAHGVQALADPPQWPVAPRRAHLQPREPLLVDAALPDLNDAVAGERVHVPRAQLLAVAHERAALVDHLVAERRRALEAARGHERAPAGVALGHPAAHGPHRLEQRAAFIIADGYANVVQSLGLARLEGAAEGK